MQIGSLIIRTKADNPKQIGLLGIAIEKMPDGDCGKDAFIVLWSDGLTGRGWKATSWGMEVICK